MPVYEYKCGSGHHYEKTEGFDAPREHSCPTCGVIARRQISLPAVIFKGSGFYSTDNRKSHAGSNGRSADAEPVSGPGDAASSSDSTTGPSKLEATAAD